MPAPVKPDFPNPSVQNLQQDLERLGDAVRQLKMADGKVDVATLERRLENDPAAARGFEAIKDEFQRTESRVVTSCGTPVTVGCGSTTPLTRDVNVDPKELAAVEVASVLDAIIAAKQKVAGLDKNSDGKVNTDEAPAATDLSGFSGELAYSAVAGSLAGYKKELAAWNQEVNRLHNRVERRGRFDEALQSTAAKHAETSRGKRAILAAYREMATRGAAPDKWRIDDLLHDAETSWLRFVPFFGDKLARGPGHLSDKELCKLFRADDLDAFADGKEAQMRARLGGDYATVFLAGRDLDGIDQVNDPDFDPSTSSC